MPISFDQIPDGFRAPLFYIETSVTGTFSKDRKSLLIGQKLAAGAATAEMPVQVSSLAQAKALFGAGSMLASMMEFYRRGDPTGEVWALPLADDAAGVKATGTIEITGPATGSGTLVTYIAGRAVKTGVVAGDTATEIGAALAAAINTNTDLPVTAAADTGTVTLTARHKGASGNDIDIRVNYQGLAGGESLPAGVSVDITDMANGATNPDITAALSMLGDEEYDFVAMPYTDTTNLDAVKDSWGDVTGRWSWLKQIYGHVFSARTGGLAALGTFGNGRNDPHISVMGVYKSPTPPWEWAASLCAVSAVALFNHPARPLQTLPLPGVKAPALADRFDKGERNILLHDGIATYAVQADGTVTIERAISTYQLNAFGQADNAWLDVQTPATIWNVVRRLRYAITSKYARYLLVNNGTRIGAGQPAVSPNDIRAELIAEYALMVRDGLVENIEAFAANLIVERDVNDPNRLNVLYKPDLVNQLNIFAVHADFQLQYAIAA